MNGDGWECFGRGMGWRSAAIPRGAMGILRTSVFAMNYSAGRGSDGWSVDSEEPPVRTMLACTIVTSGRPAY